MVQNTEFNRRVDGRDRSQYTFLAKAVGNKRQSVYL